MKIHDLSVLLHKREKTVSVSDVRKTLAALRGYLSNKRNKKVADVLELLLTSKK